MRKVKGGNPILFLIIFFTAVAFAIAGLLFPPPGQIDNSLLILIAQFLVLSASIYGFELHVNVKEGKVDAGKVKEEFPESTES